MLLIPVVCYHGMCMRPKPLLSEQFDVSMYDEET